MIKYKNKITFIEEYGRPDRVILANSPELLFIEYISRGDEESAVALFSETKQFGGAPAVDAPHGRCEGTEEIGKFAANWLASFKASHAFVQPVIQTRAGGRSVTEMVVNFNQDGEYLRIPMLVVGDLRAGGRLDGLRIYFHYSMAPGFRAYRPPIYQPSFNCHGEFSLLTGVVGEYYQALHGRDVDRMLSLFGESIRFGGYGGPEEVSPIKKDTTSLRKEYEMVLGRVPDVETVRFEAIIDDGITGVIEWTLIVTDYGRKKFRRCNQGGIAAYERSRDGKLISIRICDYMDHEDDIDPQLREEIMKKDAQYKFKAFVEV